MTVWLRRRKLYAFSAFWSFEYAQGDRLELSGGKIVSLRRYFDTLGLLAECDPTVTALRAALLSNAR